LTEAAHVTLTLLEAAALHEAASHAIRRRCDPRAYDKQSRESGTDWATATRHVAAAMGDGEATAVLRYLVAQVGLCKTDVLLANALAVKLGLVLTWKRTTLETL
jgi:hypothetical protein